MTKIIIEKEIAVKTNDKQYYTDLELMAWVDHEKPIDNTRAIHAGKLTPADLSTAELFISTGRLLQRLIANS